MLEDLSVELGAGCLAGSGVAKEQSVQEDVERWLT